MSIRSLCLYTRREGTTLRRVVLLSSHLGRKEGLCASSLLIILKVEPRASLLCTRVPVYPWCRPVTAWWSCRVYPGVYTRAYTRRCIPSIPRRHIPGWYPSYSPIPQGGICASLLLFPHTQGGICAPCSSSHIPRVVYAPHGPLLPTYPGWCMRLMVPLLTYPGWCMCLMVHICHIPRVVYAPHGVHVSHTQGGVCASLCTVLHIPRVVYAPRCPSSYIPRVVYAPRCASLSYPRVYPGVYASKPLSLPS